MKLEKNDLRVVIVGAGPAGLISALNLIQVGISPVILEKQSAIRSTACGEACGLKSLNKIPFNSAQYIYKKIKGAKLIYWDGTCSYMNKSSVTLDRTNWLKGMAREVELRGGRVRLNSEVLAVDENSIQLKNGERIDYEILIGADGPNSRIAKHLGIEQQFTVASQYKLVFDDSDMDFLEFYVDRRFSPDYSWIFPKDGIINVGTGGDFTALDAFLEHKGLSSCKKLDKEAGVIPDSRIQRLVQHNIALIGDSASMVNAFSGAGLTPIIYSAELLARNISNLENYEREVKRHPMANPVLYRARRALSALADKDVVNLLRLITEPSFSKVKVPFVIRIIKYISLVLKLRTLINTYRTIKIAKTYGW